MAMKTAVIMRALSVDGKGPKSLWAAERHGQRKDWISQKRRVRDEEPIVWKTLDLMDAYKKHVKGARMNKALKSPVLHHLFQFPVTMNGGERPTRDQAEALVRCARGYIERVYGKDACFAARMDRDERGHWVVDTFSTPKYQKRSKRARPNDPGVTWVSTTRHGKALCEKHRAEIERRHEGKFLNGPRQVGIAMQSEWREYLNKRIKNLNLAPKAEKAAGPVDRLEPEEYKLRQDRAKLEAEKEAVRHGQDCLETGLDAISEGLYLPEPRPGTWRPGPAHPQNRERAKSMLPWLTSEWWREAGREIWETIIRPAAAVRWGSGVRPDQEVGQDATPEIDSP